MIFRGIIKSITAVLNKRMRASIKGRSNENLTNVPIYQQFGFQSNPPAGSECIVAQAGEMYQIIATEGKHAAVASGDAILYNNGYACRLKLEGNTLTIFGTTKVIIESSGIELGAGVDLKTLVNSTFETIYNTHTHLDVSNASPFTGVPIPASLMIPTNFTTKTKAE